MKIILIAYKIEKDKGSEDGSGYHIIRHLIKPTDQVTLISRKNNIEKLRDDPNFKGVELIGVDVPTWCGFFKKKARGIILYYYLWQWFVGRVVNRLQAQNHDIDVIHQLNFHADWTPHFIEKHTAKLIYGPIAHHDRVRTDFRFTTSGAGEWIKQAVKSYFWRFDPFVKRAVKRSDVIFYANENIAPAYQKHRNKIHLQPYAGSVFPVADKKDMDAAFTVLFVGRFVDLKGCLPAIDAFAKFVEETGAKTRFVFVGQGALEEKLKTRADYHNIAACMRFIPWVDQADLQSQYQSAHVFLYPSVEAQGLVVTEALSSGCPVICLDGTGPSFLSGPAGLTVSRGSYKKTVTELADRLKIVYTAFEKKTDYQKMVVQSITQYQNNLTWDTIVKKMRSHYDR